MSMPSQAPVPIRFGSYQVDLQAKELRRSGILIHLAPQPFRVLLLLLQRQGAIVTREEMRQQLWGEHTYVDFEKSLNTCIRQIRAALSDEAAIPRYVETVPRQGYRFIYPVSIGTETRPPAEGEHLGVREVVVPIDRSSTEPSKSTGWRLRKNQIALFALCVVITVGAIVWRWAIRSPQPAISPGSDKRLLVVLPFQNLSGDAAQNYLTDGVTEEITTQLSRVDPQHLGVIARTSAEYYAHAGHGIGQIGRELGVQYVLEGSVRRDSNRMRITAQLIRVTDQSHLWVQEYDGAAAVDNLLNFQSEVAQKIAGSLSLEVLKTQRLPKSIGEAEYEAYLHGRYELSQRTFEGFDRAIQYFQKAIQINPNYAAAYAGLADSYSLQSDYYEAHSPPQQILPDVKRAAERAIQLAPDLAEAQTTLAFIKFRFDWDYTGAEAAFRRAIEFNPNYATAHHWYGIFLASQRRFPEAQSEFELARKFDPLSLIITTNAGWADYFARNYDQAIRRYNSVLELSPDMRPALVKIVWAYEQKGMYAEATAARQRRWTDPGLDGFMNSLKPAYDRAGYKAVLERCISFESQHNYLNKYELAMMYMGLGDRDRTIATLNEAYRLHSAWLVYLQADPAFDPLRSDPRFVSLLHKVRLQ